jgi:hypothetical protein
VQLQQIEAGSLPGQRRRLELPANLGHRLDRQLPRRPADPRSIGQRRGRDQVPAGLGQRIVIGTALRRQGRSLAAGVPELQADRRRGGVVHEVHDPPPRLLVLGRVHAAARRGDPALG